MASTPRPRRNKAAPAGATSTSRPGRASSDRVLGEHPAASHPFGKFYAAKDGKTKNKVPHRALTETKGSRRSAVQHLRKLLLKHHASPDAMKRTEERRKAMESLGLAKQQAQLRRFPKNPDTQKGNLAEIVLAEYIVATSGLILPVYRLRYNPNIDQSMKGDDVLAFDLDSDPVRIVVGEAKFRGVSSTAAVAEIVAGLVRSHKAGVPASLQFVADRLFEQGQTDLGTRVLNCALLFARGTLRLDYVGLLLSDGSSGDRVDASAPATRTRLAMISVGVEDPVSLVTSCYQGLE